MKRKATDDNFDAEGDTTTKVRRLLQHRSGTIETPGWHEQYYPRVVPEADIDLRKVIDDFVALYESLDVSDNVSVKPNYSYTELVYLAVLRSPNFCLPITEIYRYIQHRFSFFRHSTREHWKNAVRHSLSKTKCFTKIGVGRGMGQTGSLNRSTFLWTIVPSSVVSFARGDYRSNVDRESGTNTLKWGYYRVNAGDFWDRVALVLVQKLESFKQMLSFVQLPGKIFAMQKCEMPSKSPPSDDVSIVKHTNVSPPTASRISERIPTEYGTNSPHNNSSVGQQLSPVITQNDFNFNRVHNTSFSISGVGSQLSPFSNGTFLYPGLNESRDSGNETMLESSLEERSPRSSSVSPSINSSYSASFDSSFLPCVEKQTGENSPTTCVTNLELPPVDKQPTKLHYSAIPNMNTSLNERTYTQCSPQVSTYSQSSDISTYSPYYCQSYDTCTYPFTLPTTSYTKPLANQYVSAETYTVPSSSLNCNPWLNLI